MSQPVQRTPPSRSYRLLIVLSIVSFIIAILLLIFVYYPISQRLYVFRLREIFNLPVSVYQELYALAERDPNFPSEEYLDEYIRLIDECIDIHGRMRDTLFRIHPPPGYERIHDTCVALVNWQEYAFILLKSYIKDPGNPEIEAWLEQTLQNIEATSQRLIEDDLFFITLVDMLDAERSR